MSFSKGLIVAFNEYTVMSRIACLGSLLEFQLINCVKQAAVIEMKIKQIPLPKLYEKENKLFVRFWAAWLCYDWKISSESVID